MVDLRSAEGSVLLTERLPAPSLSNVVARLSAAAEQGHDLLLAEAALLFNSTVRRAQIMVRSGGLWQAWNAAEDEMDIAADLSEMLERSVNSQEIVSSLDHSVFPIDPNGVALLVENHVIDDADIDFVVTVGQTLRLALRSCEGKHGDPDKLEAIRAFQRVASRILKSQNPNELFQQITHQAKARLSADICGILLLHDDELVMQRCVGNWVVETEVLRMRAGQGVAGRVLEKGTLCSIEDYLSSGEISPDFYHLARAERVRSALAVPLYAHDKILGVLEVWRRRPSHFTPQHCAELRALADLTSLAIENVRLAQAREAAASRLEDAHAELSRRYDVIRRSAQLQEALIATHLAGGKLQDIIEQASLTLGLTVAYFDRLMTLQACHPPGAIGDPAIRRIKSEFAQINNEQRSCLRHGGRLDFVCKQVVAATEHLGWIVIASPKSECDELQLALNEICVTTALHIMKETAAARALTDKIATLTWDLLDSPADLRAIALERVKECGIDLRGDIYLLACRIEELERRASESAPTSVDLENRKRAITDLVSDTRDRQREIKLFALRDVELGIIATLKSFTRARDVAEKLIADIGHEVPGASCTVGISRCVHDPMQIGPAWKDARLAQRVARQLGPNRALGLAQAGVAGLLIGLHEGVDFRDFVEDQLGKIRKQDEGQRDTLLKTLRLYFSNSCSRQETASCLAIHPKTLVYRLKKIERITGLDLDCHESRVLLDLALKMDQLLA